MALKRSAAQALTYAFTPPLVLLAASVLVVLRTVPDPWERVKWESLTALVGFVIPVATAVIGVATGRLTDVHMEQRSQRVAPTALIAACACGGVALLLALGAPRPVVAMVGVIAAWLLATTLATLAWKVSNHCSALAAIVTVLGLVLGPGWLAGLALLIPVGWARLQLGSHSPAQVVAGAAGGAAVAALAYELILRLPA